MSDDLDSGSKPVAPYVFQEFPKALHNHATFKVKIVNSKDEEDAALAEGWLTEAPKVRPADPAPLDNFDEALDPLSLSQRLKKVEQEVQGVRDIVSQLRVASGQFKKKG